MCKAILWLSFLFLPGSIYAKEDSSDKLTAKQIVSLLADVDDMWRGKSSQGAMSMLVKTANYERSLSMDFWGLGEDFFMVRITSPRKERGTATLKRKSEIYNFLPKIKRTIKIGSAMMGGSWMGSHFTNDDLVQSTRLSEDFEVSLEAVTPKGKSKIYSLHLIPKKDVAVVWGKIEVDILMPERIPVSQRFFDETGKLKRRMEFSDVEELGGRQVPKVMKIYPEDKPDEFTQITYDKLTYDVKLEEDFFSLRRLKMLR